MVWTDVMQASVMVISILVVVTMSVLKVGGISTVLDRAIDGGRLSSVP